MTQRHENAYATHMPILIGLGVTFNITSVLEYGSGQYSTKLFLDQRVFPNLKSLVTVEPFPEWQTKATAAYGPDPRFHMTAGAVPLVHYDLVFIDCEPESDKIDLISSYGKGSLNSLFVIHDSEHGPYRSALSNFSYWRDFDSYNPHTAVATIGMGIPRFLGHINTVVCTHANYLQPDDVEGWLRAYKVTA